MIWPDYVKRMAGRAAAGLHMALPGLRPARAGILVYHRTAARPPGLPEPTWNVPPERLRRQLLGLRRYGFRFIALRQAVDAWEQGCELSPRTVVVTFDDVFESVYRHAWPILEELGIPATLFLSTAYLDSSEPFPFDEWGNVCRERAPAELYRPIRVEQLRVMLASGLIEIGAHTHTHGNFSGAPQAFERDLRTCLDYLDRVFGAARPFFAYPFGRIDHGTAAGSLETAARRSGVRCALTTSPLPIDPACDPFNWGRINVYGWDTPATLRAKLSGWYGWLLGWPRTAKMHEDDEPAPFPVETSRREMALGTGLARGVASSISEESPR